MTWRILGPLAGALAVVGVTVALLAPNHGAAIDPVAQAADTTAAAGTAEFGIAGSVTAEGQTIPLNGNGVIDMRDARMRMSVGFPIPGLGQTNVEELFDGSAFYVRFPAALAQRLPGGKQWMKMNLAAMGKAAGVDLAQMTQANESNPADMLKALKGVGNSHVAGDETIRGAATTHYHADIDLEKAAERVADKQTADSIKQLLKSSDGTSMPVDVWIDRAGRVRRESVKYNAAGVGIDMTIEYSRFGVSVDTAPPPADQVIDAGALLGAGVSRG